MYDGTWLSLQDSLYVAVGVFHFVCPRYLRPSVTMSTDHHFYVFSVTHGDLIDMEYGRDLHRQRFEGSPSGCGKARLPPPAEAFPTLSGTSMRTTESSKAAGIPIHIIPDLKVKVRQGRRLGTLVLPFPLYHSGRQSNRYKCL